MSFKNDRMCMKLLTTFYHFGQILSMITLHPQNEVGAKHNILPCLSISLRN